MKPPIIVAEMSINHLGMLGILKASIKAAKDSGANVIKLKKKNVDDYYYDDSKVWRGYNFKNYRKSLELSDDDFLEIDDYCREIGIQWFCTVHDTESLEFIKQFNPPFYKVASMDSGNPEVVEAAFEACKEYDKPLVISVGGKDNNFTLSLVDRIKAELLRAYILHTVSIYPTPIGQSNINYIPQFLKTLETDKIKIGYSGHEKGFAATLLASTYGARMIERHFALSRDINIHHINAALIPSEFKQMVELIHHLRIEAGADTQEFNQDEMLFLRNRTYV